MNAVDPREWLAARGLAKIGRGRFSTAAKEALAKAESEGVVFISKAKGTTVASVPVMSESGEVVTETRVVDPFAHHHPAARTGMLKFVGESGAKIEISATQCCSACSYSFGWCKCETPTFRYWRTGEVLSLV